jgi:hypothetical protein
LQVLNNRRHVLTKNMDGCVVLWGVLEGAPLQNFGQVSWWCFLKGMGASSLAWHAAL